MRLEAHRLPGREYLVNPRSLVVYGSENRSQDAEMKTARAQWVKVLATQPDGPSLITETHNAEG